MAGVGLTRLRLPRAYNSLTMKRLRRGAGWLLLILLMTGICSLAHAEKVEDLKPTNYVNDFAGVLSPETIQNLNNLCTQLDHKANAQVAIVTIRSLDDDDIDDFASKLEERWKVGRKGSDRGLLLLLAVNDHKYRFEVGYGLEGILPDGKVGSIGRTMVPYLRQGNYDAAVSLAMQQVSQVIATDANIQLDTQSEAPVPVQRQPAQQLTGKQLLVGIIVLVVVIIVIVKLGGGGMLWFLVGMFFGGGGGGGGQWGGGGGGGGGGFGGFGGGGSGGGGASGSW
jgi:uncharacterized protein